MHRAVAGYHRMFFERNIAVDFPSAREITAAGLRPYALVIVPCPILMTADMAAALEQYVSAGGHLFVEARPGWQDERGHASAVLPGFGWDRLFGVREADVLPIRQATVAWSGRSFPTTTFAERFEVLDPAARIVARFDDGTPAAVERAEGKGRALLLGSFAGERNATDPVAMHPLGDLLAEWAGLDRPALTSSSFVELRRLTAPHGELVLLFNHAAEPARADLRMDLTRVPRSILEIVGGGGPPVPGGQRTFRVAAEIPGEQVRVYRIDY
jgi:beta-galactosidase